MAAGDNVAAEGFFQHAEHYFRVMSANGQDLDPHADRDQPQPARPENQPQPDLAESLAPQE
jgi:hypothetical protein